MGNISEGKPKFNNRRKVCGFGVNDSGNAIFTKGKLQQSYKLWSAMIHRCYHRNRSEAYKGCSISPDWAHFSNFEKWFNQNYTQGKHLDKDILFKGNKVYSANTCCFVPQALNSLLTSRKLRRGGLPLGVSKPGGRGVGYQANVNISGRLKYLGYFPSKEEAFEAYKQAKEAHIKSEAQRYFEQGDIDERVYRALMNYKIEITD